MIIPKIKFVFDRHHRASNTKQGSIELRITFGSRQKFVSTGVSCYPGSWDERNECVRTLNCQEENSCLLKIRKKALKIIGDMVDNDSIDIEAIPTLLKQKSFDKTFELYIMERMEARQVSDNTKKAYHTFYSRFLEWGKMRFFGDITEKGIRDWDEYLHSVRWKEKDRYDKEIERQYSQASIGSMHKNLKAFINDAVIDGYVKENPYQAKRIRIDKGKTRIDQFLNRDEVERIENADMKTKPLSEARDLFLIQVYSGLAFCDLMIYDFTQCRNANDYAVFSGVRKKTGVVFTFVLTPKAKAILQRYNYVLPKTTNQQYNTRLKLIADAAGIDKSISTHDGRRSCGYILLNAGVPWSVVARVLGHSSVKQTEKAYARLLDETIAEEIRKHVK